MKTAVDAPADPARKWPALYPRTAKHVTELHDAELACAGRSHEIARSNRPRHRLKPQPTMNGEVCGDTVVCGLGDQSEGVADGDGGTDERRETHDHQQGSEGGPHHANTLSKGLIK